MSPSGENYVHRFLIVTAEQSHSNSICLGLRNTGYEHLAHVGIVSLNSFGQPVRFMTLTSWLLAEQIHV